MKKAILSLVVLVLLVTACMKVPITERRQVNLLPESQMVSLSLDAYNEMMKDSKLVKKGAQYQMVQNSGNKIAKAVEQYFSGGKYAKRVQNYNWEFNLVKNDTLANAFAMPGGKVAFYTGIMDITETELGTAVVMSHEIAHAVARHGNERMSQGLAVQLGGAAVSEALKTNSKLTKDIFSQAYGIGSSLGMLKFSRKHESEADKMGLVFMALAGYDPREAVEFWTRMKANSGGQPPQFMSTHPSHETRIEDLQEFMPTALQYYNGGKGGGTYKKSDVKTAPKSSTPTSKTTKGTVKPKASSKQPKGPSSTPKTPTNTNNKPKVKPKVKVKN